MADTNIPPWDPSLRGRNVIVDGERVGAITGDRYFWRGEPLGGYNFVPAPDFVSPWAAFKPTTRNPGGPWAYFRDAKRDVIDACETGKIRRAK